MYTKLFAKLVTKLKQHIALVVDDIFVTGKIPRSVHSPDMVKLRDMKLQSHHLVVVGGGAYVGTIMHVYP